MFLAFNFGLGRPWHGHYVLLWKWKNLVLIHILPSDAFVLVENGFLFRYINTTSKNTYIPAIRIDNQTQKDILHYRYILDWIKKPPVVKVYPPILKNEIEILNHLSKTFEP